MTIDTIIAQVQGRTHAEGDEPTRDELLVAEIEWLRAGVARLEQIYNTDRVAHDHAREIEDIFDSLKGPSIPA